jgi:hypothetical protein
LFFATVSAFPILRASFISFPTKIFGFKNSSAKFRFCLINLANPLTCEMAFHKKWRPFLLICGLLSIPQGFKSLQVRISLSKHIFIFYQKHSLLQIYWALPSRPCVNRTQPPIEPRQFGILTNEGQHFHGSEVGSSPHQCIFNSTTDCHFLRVAARPLPIHPAGGGSRRQRWLVWPRKCVAEWQRKFGAATLRERRTATGRQPFFVYYLYAQLNSFLIECRLACPFGEGQAGH